jgi:hypothetical protein
MSLMNVVENGATLTKNGGCSGCPDGTAVSNQQISGSGLLQFSTDDRSSLRFVGLGSGGVGATPGDVNFAIRLQAGVAEVRESGAYKSETAFVAGDTFTVAVNSGGVTYAKNGTVFYSSANTTTAALRANVIFFDANGTIRNVGFGGVGAPATSGNAPPTTIVSAAATGSTTATQYAVPRPAGSKPVRRRR